MKAIALYQIDSFSNEIFKGNPAAVCVLNEWLEEITLQQIARENNLSETAFIVPEGDGWAIRWFTPNLEVPLCGHATLAAAYVIFNELKFEGGAIHFQSKSGELIVSRSAQLLTLDFPAMDYVHCSELPESLRLGLGEVPNEVFRVDADPNYYVIYESEQQVSTLQPDLAELAKLHPYGVVISAAARQYDCVSRYFLPSYDIPEDPVTGSIHCALVPYWSKKLNKQQINAAQLSARGGELFCENRGDRILISGYAAKYLEGKIFI